MEIDNMFEIAIGLRNKGNLTDAVNEFLKIVTQFPHHPKISVVYIMLGGVYSDLHDYNNSALYLKKATEINPKSELASLGLYISYVKLNRDKEAIEELKRYLEEYPADLYKDTLVELLGDIKNGYASSYKDLIDSFARKNGVL
jgi:tetratricopeptide (TPR) repeat protein